MIYSLRKFDTSEVAQERMKIISFYEQFGETATKHAFGADRRVINQWKNRFTQSGGKLSSLIPYSTRPHALRIPITDQKILAFIRKEREDHPRIGKEKLKPDVDIYCTSLGIPTVSVSTIGNIIKRHHFFFQKAGRIYHNPASKWAQNKAKKKKRLRDQTFSETKGIWSYSF